MTEPTAQPNETPDPSPTSRDSVTTVGRVLSSFGGDRDDVDAYMNAVADELDVMLAALQHELRTLAFCSGYLLRRLSEV